MFNQDDKVTIKSPYLPLYNLECGDGVVLSQFNNVTDTFLYSLQQSVFIPTFYLEKLPYNCHSVYEKSQQKPVIVVIKRAYDVVISFIQYNENGILTSDIFNKCNYLIENYHAEYFWGVNHWKTKNSAIIYKIDAMVNNDTINNMLEKINIEKYSCLYIGENYNIAKDIRLYLSMLVER